MSEFDLISRYFSRATNQREDVLLGIGDDCALLQVPEGMQLAVSLDTLVCGRHFIAEVSPYSLGHKALAVNLSDLAAMGASPAWVTLGLTLPSYDDEWLGQFMAGFSHLASQHNVQLIGGDTTRGPLTISIQAHGFVSSNKALRRSTASAGDLIYVSGTLGDAALALAVQQGLVALPEESIEPLQKQLDTPEPRIALGLLLNDFASSAVDVSDGLVSDLGHICKASGLGATVHLDRLPLSDTVSTYIQATNNWSLAAAAGDDYELVFTVPSEKQNVFEAAMHQQQVVTCIGHMNAGSHVTLLQADGNKMSEELTGYDHFAE